MKHKDSAAPLSFNIVARTVGPLLTATGTQVMKWNSPFASQTERQSIPH